MQEARRKEREPTGCSTSHPAPSLREAGKEAGAAQEAPRGQARTSGIPHFVLLQRETLGLW